LPLAFFILQLSMSDGSTAERSGGAVGCSPEAPEYSGGLAERSGGPPELFRRASGAIRRSSGPLRGGDPSGRAPYTQIAKRVYAGISGKGSACAREAEGGPTPW